MRRNSLVHQDEDLRLIDMVDRQHPGLIDIVFERCVIRGPGMLQPIDSHLSDNDYGISGSRLEASLWTVSPWTETVRGAIVARHCIFSECTFDDIAFVGGSELADTLRTSVASNVSIAS